MSRCLAGSDAPSQGQWLWRATGIIYPNMGSTQHLTTSWKPWKAPLFTQSLLFSPISKVLAAHWVWEGTQSLGATGWKPAWSQAPVAPLGKYWWDDPSPSLFAPSYKGWARGGTSLHSDYNWDLSLHNEWGNGGNIKYHPCYAQWEINPRWNSKSPRSYRNPDRYPGGGAFIVEHYKVFLLSLIL